MLVFLVPYTPICNPRPNLNSNKMFLMYLYGPTANFQARLSDVRHFLGPHK